MVITLLILSVALNIALIFGMVSKNAVEDMKTIRMREGLKVEELEKFGVYKSKVS